MPLTASKGMISKPFKKDGPPIIHQCPFELFQVKLNL
jgi:hypothetical protein